MNTRRPEACVSDLAFDRFITGEASEESAEALQQHVQGCARCSARLEVLQAEQRVFEAVPMPMYPAPAAEPRRRRALVTVGSVFLVAAAVLLVFLPDAPGIRSKGGVRLDFFVKRNERVFEAGQEAQLQPGDVLRFRYSTPQAGWLAVLNVDVVNNVSVFFPVYDRMAAVPPASQELLPGATELDRSLGAERVVGVFCQTDHPVMQLVELLQQTPDAAAPSGCVFETLHIHKRAP